MKPVIKRRGDLLLVSILMALLVTHTGFSTLIADRGVSSLPAIASDATRQEVRRALGDPESSEARDDGTRVERYRIRRKIESFWQNVKVGGGPSIGMREIFLLSIVMLGMEVYATGKALYASETQKFHVVFDRRPAASSHLRSKAFDASDVTLLRFRPTAPRTAGLIVSSLRT
jgi:hypothetical protein